MNILEERPQIFVYGMNEYTEFIQNVKLELSTEFRKCENCDLLKKSKAGSVFCGQFEDIDEFYKVQPFFKCKNFQRWN